MRTSTVLLACTALLLAGVVFGTQLRPAVPGVSGGSGFHTMQHAFQVITNEYVDEVDSLQLTEQTIKGMLGGLDPHSVYIPADRMRAVEESFDAEFEGIGVSYELVGGSNAPDTIVVLNVIAGGPSDDAGLISGDRIVEVDGASAVGFSHEEVQDRLKGPRGSTVTVGIRRAGERELLRIDIERDRVPIYTVDAAHMVDEQTGYIKINRFARTTHEEFMRSMSDLAAQGMERVVLDLRGNAGGFMGMAVRLADEFLPGGKQIVSAKSRHARYEEDLRSTAGGLFEEKPVIVLVDEYSASASEIVAGALQDHDRALIVGQRTFGKGLVQQQFSLADGSALRLTISRFYTPSGRLLQTPYREGELAYHDVKAILQEEGATMSVSDLEGRVPDSLIFRTVSGRPVIGGGGIIPDVTVPRETRSDLVRELIRRNVFDLYIRQLLDRETGLRHEWSGREDMFLYNFEVDEEVVHSLLLMAGEQGVDEDLLNLNDGAVSAEIRTHLKARLAMRLYGSHIYYPVLLDVDPIFQEAMNLWPEIPSLLLNT